MSSSEPDTRVRILKATWALLEQAPGAPTRMSDIAKEAGISRQAVYLHFPNRAELLIATTKHLDEVYGIDKQIEEARASGGARAALDGFVEVWGSYIPRIYPVAKALLAIRATDEAAALAWQDRMDAVRAICSEIVALLHASGDLSADLDRDIAVDLLWTLVSIRTWEQLTVESGWSEEQYQAHIRRLLHSSITAS
ncbi:MAG: TetR/AcrR family transcriptional regulator [Pseudomonadota bacterium]